MSNTKQKKSNLARALVYLKPYIGWTIIAMILSLIVSGAQAAPAYLVTKIIDKALINKDMQSLTFVAIGIVVISLAKGVCSYYRIYITNYISLKMAINIRGDMYKKLLSFSHNFFSNNKTGDIMIRFTSDTDKLLSILNNVFKAIIQVMTIILLLGKAFYTNWQLMLVCIFVFPLIGKTLKKFSKRLKSTGKDIQESFARINIILQESIGGIRVIKAFASEKKETEKFLEENEENLKVNLKNRKIDARVRPLVDFFNNVTIAAVTFYGGSLVVRGTMSAGEIMAFLTALGLTYDPIKKLSEINNNLHTAMPAVDRIYEVLDYKETIVQPDNPIIPEIVKGKVEFKDLSFSYDGKNNVLKNINLSINPGEMVAFVGQSGSGKSTIVNMIPRFYDCNSGDILIDGNSVKQLDLKSLRKSIGIVPQDTFLFSGTIYDNIAYGDDEATEEKIIEAAKMANAYDFIMDMPNGFNTEVGERGVMLSGGQKQRISIARAILENPSLMILDEATSALDTESEKIVQDALDRVMESRTTFVIAHRLSTILHADKIVVMHNGEIKEIGTHEELLKRDSIYKNLYETQFGKIKEK